MAELTKDANYKMMFPGEGYLIPAELNAETNEYFKNTAIGMTTGGDVEKLDDTVGMKFMGFTRQNEGIVAVNATKKVQLITGTVVVLSILNVLNTSMGDKVHVSAHDTYTMAAGNNVVVGVVVAIIKSGGAAVFGEAWVDTRIKVA